MRSENKFHTFYNIFFNYISKIRKNSKYLIYAALIYAVPYMRLAYLFWDMAKEDFFAEQQLERFGKRLKQIRKQKGYTNYEHFAYRNGFNRVQYGRYENGANIYTQNTL